MTYYNKQPLYYHIRQGTKIPSGLIIIILICGDSVADVMLCKFGVSISHQ